MVEKFKFNFLDNTTRLVNGRYKIDLPWKPNSNLINNYCVALKQLQSLQERLAKIRFTKIIRTDVSYEPGKILRAASSFYMEAPSRLWYLPHHEVET